MKIGSAPPIGINAGSLKKPSRSRKAISIKSIYFQRTEYYLPRQGG